VLAMLSMKSRARVKIHKPSRSGWPGSISTKSTRPLVRTCLDWTGRQYHLAGNVGAAICDHSLASGWVLRIPHTRALKVTDFGLEELQKHFGLDVAW
ncbi:hypothetical protein ACKLTP_17995, partial [Paenarthrobacter ureafaciens]